MNRLNIILNNSKNYDDDTWNGTVRGTREKIWKWALAESGLDPQEIEDAMTLAVEEGDANEDDENEDDSE